MKITMARQAAMAATNRYGQRFTAAKIFPPAMAALFPALQLATGEND
jgi:hypothetical protein